MEKLKEIIAYVKFALKPKAKRDPKENYELWCNAAKSARNKMMNYASEKGCITPEEWRITFAFTSEDPHLNREAGQYDDLPF